MYVLLPPSLPYRVDSVGDESTAMEEAFALTALDETSPLESDAHFGFLIWSARRADADAVTSSSRRAHLARYVMGIVAASLLICFVAVGRLAAYAFAVDDTPAQLTFSEAREDVPPSAATNVARN